MAWMLSRVLMLVLGTGVAGGLGYWLGEWTGMPHLAAALAAASAVVLMAVWDAARAHRLVTWLRGEQVYANDRGVIGKPRGQYLFRPTA